MEHRFSKTLNLVFALLGIAADVVTVTSGTAGNAGNVAASLITYLSAKLLEVAELNTILDQFGVKEPLPSNSSKMIRQQGDLGLSQGKFCGMLEHPKAPFPYTEK